MNEVEKMYENAGIKKFEPKGEFSLDDCEEYCIDNNCKECSWRKYPPFTAEKQLELIKWLVHKSILSITIASNNDYHVCGFGWTGDFKADFNEAIASYINNLWQDLTDTERKQIKEILE